MEFTSLAFFLFVPIVFLLYWMVFKPLRWQNVLIVAASYFFYGFIDWQLTGLLMLTTASSYATGLLIDSRPHRRRLWTTLCIILNLGILAYFKYFNFFVESLRAALLTVGYEVDWFTIKVLLPVGISFYTFQALSYAIDVCRGKIAATRDAVAFAAYLSFFPQLVAGPIERSTSLLPQFLKPRRWDHADAVTGMRQILWGFFKKLVVADNCAAIANNVFDKFNDATGPELILGVVCFTLQIYSDFSGYSDIAIGTARLFAIRLTRNFNMPLFATNIADFWRRWHISLTRWFTDYLYIPLGGSRHGSMMTVVNIMIVFTLSGLWHGAAWTFVAWGVYNGILVAAYNVISRRNPLNTRQAGDDTMTLRRLPAMIVTFILVVTGLIFFRADSIADAFAMIGHILAPGNSGTFFIYAGNPIPIAITILMSAIMLSTEWLTRRRRFPLDIEGRWNAPVRWSVYVIVTMAILMFNGTPQQFIYFRF